MDRGVVLLQGLRNAMQARVDRIRKATYATNVTFVPHANGEFSVRIEWKTKSGAVQHFEKMYTRQEVFGASYGNSPLAWRVQRRPCDYTSDLMRQVLAARGV